MRLASEILAVVLVCAVADIALAEVCDKIAGESWQLKDGPVTSYLGQTGFDTVRRASILSVGICAAICATCLLMRHWIAASLTVAATLLFVTGLLADVVDPVHVAAINEGCAIETIPVFESELRHQFTRVVQVALFAAVVQLFWNQYRRRKAT